MEKMDDKIMEIFFKILDIADYLSEEKSFLDIVKDYSEFNSETSEEICNICSLIEIIYDKHNENIERLNNFISHLREVL